MITRKINIVVKQLGWMKIWDTRGWSKEAMKSLEYYKTLQTAMVTSLVPRQIKPYYEKHVMDQGREYLIDTISSVSS